MRHMVDQEPDEDGDSGDSDDNWRGLLSSDNKARCHSPGRSAAEDHDEAQRRDHGVRPARNEAGRDGGSYRERTGQNDRRLSEKLHVVLQRAAL
jgi:hypothetical protein